MHTFSRQVHWLQSVFWYEHILRIGGIQIFKANKGYIAVTIQATCSISSKRLQSSFCHIKDQHSNFFRFLDAANQIADIDGQSPFLFCNPHVANHGGRTCKEGVDQAEERILERAQVELSGCHGRKQWGCLQRGRNMVVDSRETCEDSRVSSTI